MYGTPVNKCAFIGNVGKVDPSYTGNGRLRLKINLAVHTRRKVDDEWKDETTWVPVVAWGALAESMQKTCKKRAIIAVDTSYTPYTYESNGETRYGHNFTAIDYQVIKWAENDQSNDDDSGDEEEDNSDGGDIF